MKLALVQAALAKGVNGRRAVCGRGGSAIASRTSSMVCRSAVGGAQQESRSSAPSKSPRAPSSPSKAPPALMASSASSVASTRYNTRPQPLRVARADAPSFQYLNAVVLAHGPAAGAGPGLGGRAVHGEQRAEANGAGHLGPLRAVAARARRQQRGRHQGRRTRQRPAASLAHAQLARH